MMILAIALPELAWNADFFGRLVSGRNVLSLRRVHVRRPEAVYFRALSLFHVALPVLLLWMVHRLGYDRRAWAAARAESSGQEPGPLEIDDELIPRRLFNR
jgi:hypothetical protein